LNGLKSLQPSDIDFISVKRVDGMFNARFSCKCKTYRYVINNGEYDVFKSNYEYFYKRKVNISLLKKGLNLFKGEHDFKSFSTSVLENTKRIIYKTSIVKKGHYLYVEITGNGFLRNMVRMIMGSLIDLNEKKKSLNDIKNLLNIPSKGSAIAKIKACGLYLVDVKY
jgi:tRNA pseudouridine38-40 synthase